MQVIGQNHDGVDRKRTRAAHIAKCRTQFVDVFHQKSAPSLKQRHGEEECATGNGGADVMGHGGSVSNPTTLFKPPLVGRIEIRLLRGVQEGTRKADYAALICPTRAIQLSGGANRCGIDDAAWARFALPTLPLATRAAHTRLSLGLLRVFIAVPEGR